MLRIKKQIMKKQILLLLLAAININSTFAQSNYFLVSGKVSSKIEQKGVPFANIQIESTTYGTVANIDGDYELKIPLKYKEKLLVFSSLGYKMETAKINAKLNVVLEEDSYQLDEVTVKPMKPLELLRRAIAEIQKNYSTKPVYLDAFYRSLSKEDTTYISLMEAACTFNYAGYTDEYDKYLAQKQYFAHQLGGNCVWHEGYNNYFDLYTNPNDQVKIIESRISENNSKLLIDQFTVGGPLNIIAADKVKFLNEFMDEKHFRNYKYKIEGSTTYNNREVIILSFKPKKLQFRDRKHSYACQRNRKQYYNAEFEGNIYIDLATMAFIRFNYQIKKVNPLQRMQPDMLQVRIDYKQINNKWYLSQVYRRLMDLDGYPKKVKIDSIAIEEQLIVNRIRTKEVVKFNPKEIFPHSNFYTLYRHPMGYNKEYWTNNNNITHNKLSVKATLDLQHKKPLEQQFIDMQQRNDSMPMPMAKKQEYSYIMHNDTLVDNYKWLENKDNEDVIGYLKEENRYTYNYFVSLRDEERRLFKDMMQKNPPSKSNNLYYEKKNGNYTYYLKYAEYAQNPTVCRRIDSIEVDEQQIIDLDSLGNSYENFYVFDYEVSPDNNFLLLGIDTVGNERGVGFLVDIKTGVIQNERIANYNGMVWMPDNRSFYYVCSDSTNRSSSLYRHAMGTSTEDDELLYFEKDATFDIGIRKSEMGNYIFMTMGNFTSQELRYLDLNKPNEGFKIFYPREENHIYSIKEGVNNFYILSNKNAINNRLFKVAKNNIEFANWKEVIATKKDTLLEQFYVLENHLIVSEMHNATNSIKVVNLSTNSTENVKIDEEFYSLSISKPNYYSQNIIYIVSTFINPSKTYEYNLLSGKTTLIDEVVIPNYSPNDYVVERVWSKSNDGTMVPISLAYKKKIKTDDRGFRLNKKVTMDGNNPLILEAYGAYGDKNTPDFSIDKISMLDKGFIYAIAHVRGGGEMGNEWHESGKLMNKRNTFNDYISCAEFLISEQYTNSSLLFGLGASAGGMLMGGVANMKPELFRGIILEYPAVCALNWLTDSTNPNFRGYGKVSNSNEYRYIKSYSPYGNVVQQKYPAMLFISGLNDERVPYWNATKMVAKLRTHNLSKNPILLKTYNWGHTGGSERYSYYKEMAYEYTFFISLLKNKD